MPSKGESFSGPTPAGGYLFLLCLISLGGAESEENYCRDLPDYSKLYYTKVEVEVCQTSVERTCRPTSVTKCINTPQIDCRVSRSLMLEF